MIEKTTLEKKILPILNYVGIIGAAIMTVAYIIAVFVLIKGFKAETLLQTTIFGCVNAATGFVIMQFLKVQGVSFAKMLPENQEVIKEYYRTKTKDKKAHSITFFWTTSVIKDIVVKCATLAATTIGLIYIVIQGSNDYNLLFLAIVNLLMFMCFGFISLVNAYDFYNNNHVPYMTNKLNEAKETKQDTPRLPEQAERVEEQNKAGTEEIQKAA